MSLSRISDQDPSEFSSARFPEGTGCCQDFAGLRDKALAISIKTFLFMVLPLATSYCYLTSGR
jgi:hypothetical protein